MDIDGLKKRITVDENGCWIWTRCKKATGYGWLTHNNKNIMAHRLSWILHNGDIPEGSWVLHKCDVRACCNPDHLYLGSPSDNMQDMWDRGRHSKPNGLENAKLTVSQVMFIKQNLGTIPQRKLGAMFGVGQTTIAMISRGSNWSWV